MPDLSGLPALDTAIGMVFVFFPAQHGLGTSNERDK
jgi:hypothetical protein